MQTSQWGRRLTSLGRVLAGAVRSSTRERPTATARPAPAPSPRPAPPRASAPSTGAAARHGAYAGDYRGVPELTYDPIDDADADPGEVVWAWVPYEEDFTQGKDRPVLVIGRDGPLLLAVAFTSQDHDRDAAQEARAGRHWFDIGSGDWDRSGRPSEVRLDRVLRLDPQAVRREGATLDRDRFSELAAAMRAVREG